MNVLKSKYYEALEYQRISENNHRISVSMKGSDLCLFFKSGKISDDVGRHRDMVVAMFQIEMDIDFRVLRTVETRHFLRKARRCLRGSLSRVEQIERDHDEGVKSNRLVAANVRCARQVLQGSSELG